MSEVDPTMATDPEVPPRATTGVLAILAAIIALPLLAILIVTLVRGGAGSSGGADVADAVRGDRVQAVYMANDRVFFGDLEAGAGDWLELQDAFYLRSSPAEDAKEGEDASVTNLVPVEQEVGGDGTLVINSAEVVLVQNLTADSPIAREIEDTDQ